MFSFFHSKVVSVWRLRPQTPPGLCPWTPLRDLCPQTPWIYSHRKDFLATPLVETHWPALIINQKIGHPDLLGWLVILAAARCHEARKSKPFRSRDTRVAYLLPTQLFTQAQRSPRNRNNKINQCSIGMGRLHLCSAAGAWGVHFNDQQRSGLLYILVGVTNVVECCILDFC